MRKSTATVQQCRQAISSLIGKKVTVRHNAGRNKVMVFVGTVSEVYGGVFVIKTENGVTDRRTFSYQDMLCGDIRLRAAPENPPRETQ